MEQRIKIFASANQAFKKFSALGEAVHASSLGMELIELVCYRVSQINQCAQCLDVHSKELLVRGEVPQRLFLLSSWREAPFYTTRERAALAYAEELTSIKHGVMPDSVYSEAREQFTEEELIDLTMTVIVINGYNRINNAFGAEVGTYQPRVAANAN